MKKVILIIVVSTTTFAVKAQSLEKNTPAESKTEYVFMWGLFKSKDYPKGKSVAFEIEKPEFSTSLSEPPVDSSKYEQKSMLWGAIQWTEKEKQ